MAGLALIIWLGYTHGNSSFGDNIVWLPGSWVDSQLLILGSFIAFYAFIGFEDLVNLAEEVKDPHRTIPIALILTIVLALIFYLLVAVAVFYALPLHTIQNAQAPLAEVLIAASLDPKLISGISMLAVVNGIMVQIIMASRALYGMAKQKIIPGYFGYLNPHSKTPTISILFVCVCIFIFSAIIPIKTLASLTSFTMLIIFCLVNISLIKLKYQNPIVPTLNLPIWVPYIGFILCFMLASFEIIKSISLPL